MKEEKKTTPATASAMVVPTPIVTPSFNIELVDVDGLPFIPPTLDDDETAPEMKNNSTAQLKMKKERFTANVAAAAAVSSWEELQRDKVDHHQQQRSSPRIDSSSWCNEDKGAAAAAATTPNKEQEEGVVRERGLNLLEDMGHDDNSSSSVDTTIYEDWRDKANDNSLRKKVMMNIYKALITEFKHKNMYSLEWKRKLPQLVHRLESMHYHKSPTRDVYLDINPKKVKNSLKRLAKSI